MRRRSYAVLDPLPQPRWARGQPRASSPIAKLRTLAGVAASRRAHPAIAPPSRHGSRDYVDALREVHALGVCSSLGASVPSRRRNTRAKRLIGTFWRYYGRASTGTLHRLVGAVVRKLCTRLFAGGPEATWASARLLALVDGAMAGATIVACDAKCLECRRLRRSERLVRLPA